MAENKANQILENNVVYDKNKIQEALNLLDKLQVTGVNQSNILCNIFNILANPVNMSNGTENK